MMASPATIAITTEEPAPTPKNTTRTSGTRVKPASPMERQSERVYPVTSGVRRTFCSVRCICHLSSHRDDRRLHLRFAPALALRLVQQTRRVGEDAQVGQGLGSS